MTKIGDLLPLGDAYMQDDRFVLVTDADDLEHVAETTDIPAKYTTGALVALTDEGDTQEVWVTNYRAPYALTSVYERAL